jgi:hypothetical protein
MAIVKKKKMPGVGEGVQKENVHTLWWEGKLVQPLWKTAWKFLRTLITKPQFDPIISLLGIYLKELRLVCLQLLTRKYLDMNHHTL